MKTNLMFPNWQLTSGQQTKMMFHCELYVCNINIVDIPEEVNLTWISQLTDYSNSNIICLMLITVSR